MDSAETSNCTSGVCDPSPSFVSDSDLSSTDTLSESDISSIDASSTDSSSTDCTVESGFENDALVLLKCFREHKLTDSACHDILKVIRHVLPGEKGNPLLNYRKVLSQVPETNYREVKYCCRCESIIHGNGQIPSCSNEDCSTSVKNFMVADIKELLTKLLNAPGMPTNTLQTNFFISSSD